MFCKHKLSVQEVSDLQSVLDDILYTCGMTFDDLDLPGRLVNVFVKDHSCADSIENLYYYDFTSLFVSIVHQKKLDTVDSDFLPQYQQCMQLEHVRKPKKKS